MFAKLLKHEWKATSGLLGVFSLAALIAGAVGAVALRFIVRYADSTLTSAIGGQGGEVETIAASGLAILLAFVMLGLLAYYFGTQIVLLFRFYKHKFTDEGYLTFTLPVKSHEILAASWLNMLIWTLISMAVVAVALGLMVICAAGGLSFFDKEMVDSIVSFYSDIPTEGGEYVALTLASGLLEWLVAPLIAMTCITIGAVGAKKHKILLAIAVYYGYSMAAGIISTVITAVVTIASYKADGAFALNVPLICGILIQGLVAVVCWFLTNYLVSSKLNLP